MVYKKVIFFFLIGKNRHGIAEKRWLFSIGIGAETLHLIVSAGKHFSNTNLSDLSIVGTCDIIVYRMLHQIM